MSISIEGSASIGWLHQEYGLVADEAFYFDPELRARRMAGMQDRLARRFPDYEINFFESNLIQSAGWRREQLLVGALQPNMILGMAVGARFVCPGDKDPDISAVPLADLAPDGLARLREMDWATVAPVRGFLERIDALKARYGDSRPILPPLFWDASGRVSVHGPVTTAQKLIGERVYLEMSDRPEFVHGLLDWITTSYLALARLGAARAGIAIRSVHVGECSGCMLGPEQFDAFSAPYIQRLIDALGPGRIHTCGHSDHLVDCFARLKRVSCINTGSRTSVRLIRERCGPGVRVETAPPAQLLGAGTVAEAREFIDRSVAENGGPDAPGELGFVHHLDRGYPLANVTALHERLFELGLVRRGRRHPAGAAG